VGGDRARPGAEHLVGLATPLAALHPRVLVVAGGEGDVELAVGGGDAPGLHRVVPAVVPGELAPGPRQPAVEAHTVLGEPRPVRPLGPELEPDDVVAGSAGAPTPVPRDVARPAAPADVEHAPGVPGCAADLGDLLSDRQAAGGGASLVL